MSEPVPDQEPGRRATLTQEQVITAALAVAQREGLDSLSMRRLAVELGVTPMATYYWVKDKDTLLALVAESVCSTVQVPGPETGTWCERLAQTHRSYRAALRSCPGLAGYLLDNDVPPSGRRVTRETTSLLKEAGFALLEAQRLLQAFEGYLLGRLAIEAVRSRQQPSERTAAALEAEFEYGLQLLLHGAAAAGATG
ncbi:MAG: TetR/AcrR family transcriptional regulator, tetracycline repressor protein [Acidimicrobiaceae bacterium]|jgi:AcrR family transcriptional regulator